MGRKRVGQSLQFIQDPHWVCDCNHGHLAADEAKMIQLGSGNAVKVTPDSARMCEEKKERADPSAFICRACS